MGVEPVPSRDAAKEYSPWRKPWVRTKKTKKAPEGRKSNLIHDGKLLGGAALPALRIQANRMIGFSR
jgi:hypothetical protein